jgi:hypothetical protein
LAGLPHCAITLGSSPTRRVAVVFWSILAIRIDQYSFLHREQTVYFPELADNVSILQYTQYLRSFPITNGSVRTGADRIEGGGGRFLNKKSSWKLTKTIDVTRRAASAA